MVARRVLVCSIAACAPEPPTELVMSFARDGFYDAPFPSDDLRKPDGHIDLAKLPDPERPTLMQQALALIAGADGFAQTGAIYFRATAPLDGASLPDLVTTTQPGAAVFLVSVDPSREDFMRRRPIEVAALEDGGPFGAPDLLALLPLQGVPLGGGETYAAVVTTAVRDRAGRAIGSSPELAELIAGRTPGGLDGAALATYRRALGVLADHDVDARTIAAVAVFTTEHATAALDVVRADALVRALPQLSPPTPGETFDDYCVFNASIDMPVYQAGEPPYTRDGGAWRFDSAGKPIVDHFETARVVFTIPHHPTPAGGWPLVVFARTGGGGDRPLVDRGACATPGFTMPIVPGSGPARDLAQVGFAGVMIDGPLGGIRNPDGLDEEFSIFNALNPAALRDNVRQSAVELAVFQHVVTGASFEPAGCGGSTHVTFDASHVALMGHSMGAWIAPLALATEPGYGAAVLSGAGGSFIANIMDKQKPLAPRTIIAALLDSSSLERHDPGLTLLQWAAEPADPQVYAPSIVRTPTAGARRRSVLMLQGIVDHYIPPSVANALSLALGLDEVGAAYDVSDPELQMLEQPPLGPLLPLAGRSMISLPATANIDAWTTAVVAQHLGDSIEDGHETMFQTEAPKHQYRCFLASWLAGAPRVPRDGAASDPCGP